METAGIHSRELFMKMLIRLAIFLLFCEGIYGQVTVHILNPWRNDTCAGHRDTLLLQGDPAAGLNWSPGVAMPSEGGGWFNYAFDKPGYFVARIASYCGPETWRGWVEYELSFNLDTIFGKYSEGTRDIWIAIADSTLPMVITDQPPVGAKFIYFLSAWSIGAPRIIINGYGSPKMSMDTSISRCGWFKYPYLGSLDSVHVKFMNSFDSTLYSSTGLGDGEFIDLSTVFQTGDTAWVLPTPPPEGPPTVHTVYPGYSAPCERTIMLRTTLRDYDSTHPDMGGFWEEGKNSDNTGCWKQGDWGAPIPGMVERQLDANGKPVINSATPCRIADFNWFTTETVMGQYINAICYDLKLTKNSDGMFELDTGFFFPADTFRYLDDLNTVPNPRYDIGTDGNGNEHNFYFTVEIDAQFQYVKGQRFYFRGDDDVWVFIDNRLVVDLGGVHNPMEGSVNLDTLGLTVGNTYSFKMFFCERNMPGSSFRMFTSIKLETSSNLFAEIRDSTSTTRIWEMNEKVTQTGLACDAGQAVIDTQRAIMDFMLDGPSFSTTGPVALDNGLHYGGITIRGDSAVILDSTAVTGLVPGSYMIKSYLRSDHSQQYNISFIVSKPPADHLDILTDEIPFDHKKDAVVDSIVIGMLETDAEAYAVIRDAGGTYLNHATDPVWTIKDTSVVRVESSPVPSHCILTKVNAGQTWLVVHHAPGLKPDSVLVITRIPPPYPIIVSGIFRDHNADLVTDMLHLTLSDTFKVDQQLDSVQIRYRETITSIPANEITIEGVQLAVPLPETWKIDGRPEGTATLYLTVGGESKNSTGEVTDGVCPAIIAADVLENDASEAADILFLTFSERFNTGSIIGRQLLLIKKGTTDTVALTVAQILALDNDSTFTVKIAPSVVTVVAGDRLRLLPRSAGGTLADWNGNGPHDLNRSVVIGFRAGAASIAAAWYRDKNADGIIDEVLVRFKRAVELSEINNINILWNQDAFSFASANFSRLNDSTFRIDVEDSLVSISKINTGGNMYISVEYTSFSGITKDCAAADSAAPVIVAATLTPGTLNEQGIRENDLLEVVFSEPAMDFNPSPFLLSTRKDGRQYTFSLDHLGSGTEMNSHHFVVRSISNTLVPFASAGDTIWINPSAEVNDSGGVNQTNPLNRRVSLQVDWPDPAWNIRIAPNPFSKTSLVPGSGGGTAILLTPTAPIDNAQTSARIIIYDPVGNTVKESDFEPFNSGFRFIWNGTNRKGRYVGTGTYLAVIAINNANTRQIREIREIGFRNR